MPSTARRTPSWTPPTASRAPSPRCSAAAACSTRTSTSTQTRPRGPVDGAVAADANVAAPIDASMAANIGSDGRSPRRGRPASRHPPEHGRRHGGSHRRPERRDRAVVPRPAGRRAMSATVDRPAARAATAPPTPRAWRAPRVSSCSGRSAARVQGRGPARAARRRPDGPTRAAPYGLLEELDGERDAAALAARDVAAARAPLGPSTSTVAEKLAAQGLSAGSRTRRLPKSDPLSRCAGKSSSPTRTSRGRYAAVRAPVPPVGAASGAIGFPAVCWFVLIRRGSRRRPPRPSGNPELLLLVLGLTIASAAFH